MYFDRGVPLGAPLVTGPREYTRHLINKNLVKPPKDAVDRAYFNGIKSPREVSARFNEIRTLKLQPPSRRMSNTVRNKFEELKYVTNGFIL